MEHSITRSSLCFLFFLLLNNVCGFNVQVNKKGGALLNPFLTRQKHTHDRVHFTTGVAASTIDGRGQNAVNRLGKETKNAEPYVHNSKFVEISTNDPTKEARIIEQAYEESRRITAAYAKTFYLGTKFMSTQQARATWAIYVWCRRTDDLVDSPRACMGRTMLQDLQQWELRLEEIWYQGKARDSLDLCLVDTLRLYPDLDIGPFRDMIRGMLMDIYDYIPPKSEDGGGSSLAETQTVPKSQLDAAHDLPPTTSTTSADDNDAVDGKTALAECDGRRVFLPYESDPNAKAAAAKASRSSPPPAPIFGKNRYKTWSELKQYCYRVAGTVGLMTLPVMGAAKGYTLEQAKEPAVALGVALQITNILRDVGEDALRGRIYLPVEDMERFGVSEEQILNGIVDDNYRQLIQFEIDRAERYFQKAEDGVWMLAENARLPVRASLDMYRKILYVLSEENDYDNFRKRAYVNKVEKFFQVLSSWLTLQKNKQQP